MPGGRRWRGTTTVQNSRLTHQVSLGDILTQGAVDAGLVALAIRRAGLEPLDQIGIQAQGQLVFDRAKKTPAPRAAPILLFGKPAVLILSSGSAANAASSAFCASNGSLEIPFFISSPFMCSCLACYFPPPVKRGEPEGRQPRIPHRNP